MLRRVNSALLINYIHNCRFVQQSLVSIRIDLRPGFPVFLQIDKG